MQEQNHNIDNLENPVEETAEKSEEQNFAESRESIEDNSGKNMDETKNGEKSSYDSSVFMPNYPPVQKGHYVFVPDEAPKIKERKEIRKAAALASIACLLMVGITFIWGTVFVFLMTKLGLSGNQVMEIIRDPYVLQVLQVLISSFMFTLPFVIIYKIGGYSVRKTVLLDKPKKGINIPLIMIGVGFCAFANISVAIAGSIFEGFGFDYSVNRGEDPKGLIGFLLSFIATAIIPALVEEFACRGLILGSLKKYGDGFAIIVSSIIFGLIHGNFEQIPFAFLVGLVLGFITVKSGSIWIACLIHSINNAVSVLVDYLLVGVSGNIQILIYNIYLMLALLLGVAGIFILSKKQNDAFTLKKADTQATELEKHKYFFTHPLVIILIIECFVEALSFFNF